MIRIPAQFIKFLFIVRRHLGGLSEVVVQLFKGHLVVHTLGLNNFNLGSEKVSCSFNMSIYFFINISIYVQNTNIYLSIYSSIYLPIYISI